ncbi:hypothetical protein ABK040_012047 [Willaertia magna]
MTGSNTTHDAPVGLPLCFLIYPNYLINHHSNTSSSNNNNNNSRNSLDNSRLSISSYNSRYIFSNATSHHISTVSYNTQSSNSETSESEFTFVDSKYFGIQHLRENFENWLIESFGEKKGNFIFQKLLFLDEFFDPNKDKIRRVLNLEDLFQSLNRYLFKILKKYNIFYSNEDEKFPYLLNLKEILEKLEDVNNILNQHEELLKYLIDNSELLKKVLCDKTRDVKSQSVVDSNNNVVVVNNNNSFESQQQLQNIQDAIQREKKEDNKFCVDITQENTVTVLSLDGLKQLCVMFYLDVYNHFQLYQSINTKYITQWIVNELSNSPGYLFDNLQKRIQKYKNFTKKPRYTNDDFNTKLVIDNDFDFVKFLTKNTTDWKLHKKKLNTQEDFQMWKSKNEDYTTIPHMRNHKIVGHFNFPLELVCQSLLDSPGTVPDLVEEETQSDYSGIQTSSSVHKYPTYVHEATLNFGSLFKRRVLRNVISVKINYIGKKVQEVIHFYKTCTLDDRDDKKKDLIIAVGARIYNRLDTNSTLYTDVRISNTKGVVFSAVSSLSVGKIAKQTFDGLKRRIEETKKKVLEEKNNNGNKVAMIKDDKLLLWKSMRDYCLFYYQVDINEDWSIKN